MPTYKVTDPNTGKIVRLTGDSPPTEAELEQVFASLGQQPAQQSEQEESSSILPALESAGTIASGIVAEPIAGLAGLAQSINPFADEGAGARAVESVREALTYKGGEESQRQLGELGEFISPVTEKLTQAERFLGEETLKATGSPTLASIAHTLPTAVLELIGIKGAKKLKQPKGIKASQVDRAILEAAPQIEDLKAVARGIYKEIDDTGARVKKESLQGLATRIEADARKQGMDPRTTKVSSGVVDAIKDSALTDQPLTELDTLRNIAKAARKSTDPTEKMLGSLITSHVEDFMDSLKSKDMVGGVAQTADAGKKYRAARAVYGRAKRAEMINDAITEGANARSGAENGIRNELHKITRNKKSAKFFPKNELKAINDVVQGDFKTNLAKMIGRMGFMEGSSTSVLGSLGGIFAGSSIAGPIGGVAFPAAGIASRQIAKKLTANKAKFVESMTRAGKDAKRVAAAYLQIVPKAKRNVNDLADLLMDTDLNIAELENVANQTVKDAIDIARGRKAIDAAMLAPAALASGRNNEQNEE